VSPKIQRPRAGFTLVELLIGMSLSLMLMLAVLSSYVYLARQFTRTLGFSSFYQPTLEAQSRRTLAYFTQDVGMASSISGTPSATSVVLVIPTSSGSTTVTYDYDNTLKKLTRTVSGGSALVLHVSLLTCTFSYYDMYDRPYSSYTNYLSGIKKISLSFSSRSGNSANYTLTQVFQSASPRLLLKNKQVLP
jgi:prepilin-type N-terminal cleavage/methylation domain-containing protein